ncbi:MAG: sigma 54-interacting transcriptional regulator [Ferruginibacter sp.]
MLHLINNTLKEYIRFDDGFLLLYSEHTKTCKPYIYYACKKRSERPAFGNYINFEYPVIDNNIEGMQQPVVTDIDWLMLNRSEQIDFMHQADLKEFVTVKLIERNKLIGLFVLLSEQKQSFTSEALDLLQNISYQIAIVTANLIADEEIANRKYEQTLLLSLSNEIAAVRNKNDLLQVLNIKLKELFPIIGFGITLQNEDGITHSPFVVDSDAPIRNDIDFQKVITLKYSIEDGVYNAIVKKSEPVLLNVDEVTPMVETAAYVAFWKKLHVKQVIGNALSTGGKNIGCLIFLLENNTSQKINRELMTGVCAAVSIGVSNIKSLEEIIKKDDEKKKLLSLSNEIAAVRNKEDLAKVINHQLRELFSIKAFGIAQIGVEGKNYDAFMLDLEDPVTSHADYKEVTSGKYCVTDPVFSYVMKSTGPVILNVNDLAVAKGVPAYVSFWQNVGFQQILGVPLRVGGEDIGVAFLTVDEDSVKSLNIQLLKSMFSQVSIAIRNILSNEKIERQLNEINKYRQQLEEEKIYLKEEIETTLNYAEIIGQSAEIKKTFRLIDQVAASDSTVLLLGETGTGKELIARAIHNSSPRKNKLMVKLNCAALPANLIESELFGHERGSFTGAIERRIGKFELANNGTLFLDEIGEMPLELQVKLLRALQEQEIERVGGRATIKVDVRIIVATNRDLRKEMAAGRFRADLYYRLNIFPINLPPLRNRKEDIPMLASFFIIRFAKKSGKRITSVSNKALQELLQYDWPGNIRELEHLIERSVLLTTGDIINEIYLPSAKQDKSSTITGEIGFLKTIDDNEKEHILRVLKHVKGRISGAGGAAALLGVPPSTLNSKMKRLNITKKFITRT